MSSLAPATYVRPKAAPKVSFSMVPAYPECTAPNRVHGPPLEHPSCNPAHNPSAVATFGEPTANGAADNSVGRIELKADVGIPGPPDDSDVLMQASVTDVRCAAGATTCGAANAAAGPDYTGQLVARIPARSTDRFNAVEPGGGSDPATSTAFTLQLPLSCTETIGFFNSFIGSSCFAATSVNAIVPGWITDGKRTVFELGQVTLFDGGPDGHWSTSPNAPIMRQGVSIP